MAETAIKIKPSNLEIKISGKIVAIEQIQGRQNPFYITTIIIPAEDTFQKPQRVQINSKLPFGQEDEVVDITAHVVPNWRQNNGNWYFSCNLWKDKLGA